MNHIDKFILSTCIFLNFYLYFLEEYFQYLNKTLILIFEDSVLAAHPAHPAHLRSKLCMTCSPLYHLSPVDVMFCQSPVNQFA
jgi:hypothetical protein